MPPLVPVLLFAVDDVVGLHMADTELALSLRAALSESHIQEAVADVVGVAEGGVVVGVVVDVEGDAVVGAAGAGCTHSHSLDGVAVEWPDIRLAVQDLSCCAFVPDSLMTDVSLVAECLHGAPWGSPMAQLDFWACLVGMLMRYVADCSDGAADAACDGEVGDHSTSESQRAQALPSRRRRRHRRLDPSYLRSLLGLSTRAAHHTLIGNSISERMLHIKQQYIHRNADR
jgi:hypothetical protein